jgi:hypothetical protein
MIMNDRELLKKLLSLFYEHDDDLEWSFNEGETVGSHLGEDVKNMIMAVFQEAKLDAKKNNHASTPLQFVPAIFCRCTRPDIADCHAKVGTGGVCMNGVLCDPLKEGTL